MLTNLYSNPVYRIIRIILFIAVIAAIGFYIFNNLSSVRQHSLKPNWWLVSVSALFGLIAHIVNAGIWVAIARRYGLHTPWLDAGKAWFISRLGRYVPGKFAWFLVRLDSYRDFSPRQVGLASVLELIASLGAVAILLFSVFVSFPYYIPDTYRVPGLIFSSLLLLIIFTPISFFLINFLHIIIGLPKPKKYPSLTDRIYAISLGLIAGFLNGASLFFLIAALTEVPLTLYPTITACYYIAGQLGMLAFFAPGGLGVREGALMSMLGVFVPPGPVIVAVIGIRLISIATEVTGACLCIVLKSYINSHKSG